MVSAGELRKLWDSPSELCSSLCERRLERTVLGPALLPAKTAQFTQFFRQVLRHTVKSLNITESRIFIGPCIIIIVEELETNLMSLVIFITLNICSTCFEH